ncbi:GapA-binding peptide SR1P [Bacillus sp. V2I10]|uniref:GapA-binding peptide SR1P n=1 Tax=Bacillus sp. V2I10 TaxID=3042276 RepID=UPI0027802893|nr:GapA-binding peptide SR1P [Bacillus sp. V2I10]MDQ0862344.1 hypothetical protein [Bacillus sp. V2I10]
MENSGGSQALGAVVCIYCGKLIDTVDAEKVMTHYSNCKQDQCLNQDLQNDQGE